MVLPIPRFFLVKKTLYWTIVYCLYIVAVFTSPILQIEYYVCRHILDQTNVKYTIVILWHTI
jgi:hypothetical protein